MNGKRYFNGIIIIIIKKYAYINYFQSFFYKITTHFVNAALTYLLT